MARTEQKPDGKGSLRDIQALVNRRQDSLSDAVRQALRVKSAKIDWVSPRSEDRYAEYSDGDFLAKIGRPDLKSELPLFWPTGGPEWDALGVGDGEVFLVEAKAHLPELFSGGTGATSGSLDLIRASLRETQEALGVKSEIDWTGCFYQYANRLSHLWWLRERHSVPAFLVYAYFIGDSTVSDAPKTEQEWKAALYVMRRSLGVAQHRLSRYVADAFVDVKDLPR